MLPDIKRQINELLRNLEDDGFREVGYLSVFSFIFIFLLTTVPGSYRLRKAPPTCPMPGCQKKALLKVVSRNSNGSLNRRYYVCDAANHKLDITT